MGQDFVHLSDLEDSLVHVNIFLAFRGRRVFRDETCVQQTSISVNAFLAVCDSRCGMIALSKFVGAD